MVRHLQTSPADDHAWAEANACWVSPELGSKDSLGGFSNSMLREVARSSKSTKMHRLSVPEWEKKCSTLFAKIERASTKADWDVIVQFLDTGYWPSRTFVDKSSPKQQAMSWVTCVYSKGEKSILYTRLPLHLAVASGAPMLVVTRLVELYPQAVRCADGQGMLPIHLALQKDVQEDTVTFLLKEFPESINIEDSYGCTPIQCAERDKAARKLLRLHTTSMQDQKRWTHPKRSKNKGDIVSKNAQALDNKTQHLVDKEAPQRILGKSSMMSAMLSWESKELLEVMKISNTSWPVTNVKAASTSSITEPGILRKDFSVIETDGAEGIEATLKADFQSRREIVYCENDPAFQTDGAEGIEAPLKAIGGVAGSKNDPILQTDGTEGIEATLKVEFPNTGEIVDSKNDPVLQTDGAEGIEATLKADFPSTREIVYSKNDPVVQTDGVESIEATTIDHEELTIAELSLRVLASFVHSSKSAQKEPSSALSTVAETKSPARVGAVNPTDSAVEDSKQEGGAFAFTTPTKAINLKNPRTGFEDQTPAEVKKSRQGSMKRTTSRPQERNPIRSCRDSGPEETRDSCPPSKQTVSGHLNGTGETKMKAQVLPTLQKCASEQSDKMKPTIAKQQYEGMEKNRKGARQSSISQKIPIKASKAKPRGSKADADAVSPQAKVLSKQQKKGLRNVFARSTIFSKQPKKSKKNKVNSLRTPANNVAPSKAEESKGPKAGPHPVFLKKGPTTSIYPPSTKTKASQGDPSIFGVAGSNKAATISAKLPLIQELYPVFSREAPTNNYFDIDRFLQRPSPVACEPSPSWVPISFTGLSTSTSGYDCDSDDSASDALSQSTSSVSTASNMMAGRSRSKLAGLAGMR